MVNQSSFSNIFKIIIFTYIFFFLIKIFNIGIISDYTGTYSHLGNAILNDRDFIENLIYELKLFFFDLGFFRLVKIIQHFFGLINYIFVFKFIHFLIYVFIFIQIFKLTKNLLSTELAYLSLIIIICLTQITEYLDPFIAWPEAYATSVIIGFINISLFFKILNKKKINNLFILFNLISYFYQEMAAPYALLPLIGYLILFINNKKFEKKSFLYLLNFMLYVTLKILLIFTNSEQTVSASSSLSFIYPESLYSAFFHAVRTIPFTWLFVEGKFEEFHEYLFDNLLYLFLVFFVSYFLVNLILKNLSNSSVLIRKNLYYFNLVGFYQIIFPILLISINQRYNIQISNHGLGHAHYLILSQCIGLLFILIIIFEKFKFFVTKNKFWFSIILSIILSINFLIGDFTTNKLEPKRHLYPYIFLENIKTFVEDNSINTFIIIENENSGFWENNTILSSIFKKKINVYGNWMFNENKLNTIKTKKYENTLLINKLNLNKNLHKANFCILKSVEYNLNNNLVYTCNENYRYEAKIFLKYFNYSSSIKKIN